MVSCLRRRRHPFNCTLYLLEGKLHSGTAAVLEVRRCASVLHTDTSMAVWKPYRHFFSEIITN